MCVCVSVSVFLNIQIVTVNINTKEKEEEIFFCIKILLKDTPAHTSGVFIYIYKCMFIF